MKFNNKLDGTKDWIEIVFGGVCGVAAIIAAIVEYRLGENGALAGMLKDVFGTAVVVALLLFAAMPEIKPRKLDKILEHEVECWGENNAPFIFKAEGFKTPQDTNYTQGFMLLQDPTKYAKLVGITPQDEAWHDYARVRDGGRRPTGKFLSMPTYSAMTEKDFEITFTMGQKHFTDKANLSEIIDSIRDAIDAKPKNLVKKVGKASNEIVISFKAIQSNKDVDEFVAIIDFVLSLVKVVA